MTPDTDLLKRYAAERDEASFAELVRRHLDHVYSTALRLVGKDPHQAEDVVQSVFTDLAKKAGSLRHCVALSSWLHTSARFAAAKLVRTEQRRRQREQAAFTISNMTSTSPPDWQQIRPLLDEAIGELSGTDRDAILLRYFERKPYAEVGVALGLSENTARMRVDRAVEKLRSRLALRGITSTAAALGTALAQNVVGTAPPGLGARVVGAAASVDSAAWIGTRISTSRLALVGMVVAIIATIGIGLKSRRPSEGRENTPKAADIAPKTAKVAAQSETSPMVRGTVGDKASFGSRLRLFFVDDTSGQPVTNRVIGLRGWERNEQGLVEKQVQLDQGQCVVPFDQGAKAGYGFWILSHIEGYADVRLRWNPDRGEVVPDFYTVRLVRPALIHGQVLDTAGSPVAGAIVGFNTEELSGANGNPEDHGIDYLTARTDPRGHWQMNRLAPEMVRRLFGGATHPDYSESESINVSRQPELESRLLEGTLILHLAEGITVTGEVADQDGHPIVNALVIVGHLDSSQSWDTRTGADGSFRIKGCQPGVGTVSAEADGFAPKALWLKLEPRLAAVRLTLGQGKAVICRVVDAVGNPVPGASLSLDSFPRSGRYYTGATPIPQVRFSCDTDDQGRMAWTNAPELDLPFVVRARGFMNTDVTLKPDGEEHLIALQAALVIYGTVRDAVTGDVVPRFRLGTGWPQKRPDASVEPQWSPGERFWPSFTGGEFRHTLQEGVGGGTPNPGYVFRFEAQGHVPFITRVYQPDEGEVRLDVKLRPAEDVWVIAYTPDGDIAHDAQVASLLPGRDDVHLVPGGFTGPLLDALASIRQVDSAGWFTVTDGGDVQRIVIVHPSGYAEATLDQLKKDHAVRLGRWASLEGVWRTNDQAVAGVEISLQWASRAPKGPDLDSEAFRTLTDAQGHFAFPQVPYGSLQLVAGQRNLAEVELVAGGAKQVTIPEPVTKQTQ